MNLVKTQVHEDDNDPSKLIYISLQCAILVKRWSEAESFTIFENHVYSH